MPRSLPPRPSLEYVRKEAKDLLAAHQSGDASACDVLRLHHRFQAASDADVLAAPVSLQEVQHALALDYGFKDWAQLRRQMRSERIRDAATLEAVILRCEHEIPEYAGAGVPLAVTAALNHAGVDIDYMTFAAATGWAFSFGYKYDDISTAFLAVRGDPQGDGPYQVFAFLPTRLGFGYEWAPTKELDKLWPFVQKHVDAGTPIMSEHVDGGLVSGYRERDGKRQVYFDGTTASGWTDVEDLHPYAVYVLVRETEPLPWEEITVQALKRAVQKGSPHEDNGGPAGLAALKAYLADVQDPGKDFEGLGEWFCWAAFERLMARKCAATWLQRATELVPGRARRHVLDAAAGYEQAYRCYEDYRAAVCAGEPTPVSLEQRARTSERIAAIAPLLAGGIEAEARGIDSLRKAVAQLG